jgi:hypothetical protein
MDDSAYAGKLPAVFFSAITTHQNDRGVTTTDAAFSVFRSATLEPFANPNHFALPNRPFLAATQSIKV